MKWSELEETLAGMEGGLSIFEDEKCKPQNIDVVLLVAGKRRTLRNVRVEESGDKLVLVLKAGKNITVEDSNAGEHGRLAPPDSGDRSV